MSFLSVNIQYQDKVSFYLLISVIVDTMSFFKGAIMKRKLLDLVRDKIRFKHYSIKTEQSYVGWIKRYIFFHNKRHPKDMAKLEIEQFLTYLAVNQKVSPTTQN